MRTVKFWLLVLGVVLWRTYYGLSQNFWHDDVIQIFLLGLKYYTTGLWPYFGPDIVHTNQQIPGALQAMLIGGPLFAAPLAETPFLVVNILSVIGILVLLQYMSRRFNGFSVMTQFLWLATLPSLLQISTNTYNPSYLLLPSCCFFVAFFESQQQSRTLGWSARRVGAFMGFSLVFVFQLHMSWPLLLPFLALTWARPDPSISRRSLLGGFIAGAIISASLLIPTVLEFGPSVFWSAGAKNSNLNLSALLNFPVIFARFLILGSYEFFGFNLSASMGERIQFVKSNLLTLVPAIGLTLGLVWQVIVLIKALGSQLIRRSARSTEVERFFWSFLVIGCVFMMTTRPPLIRNFYILVPVVLVAVMDILARHKHQNRVRKFLVSMIGLSFVFHSVVARRLISEISIYKDRDKIQTAIEKKDYRILAERRVGLY